LTRPTIPYDISKAGLCQTTVSPVTGHALVVDGGLLTA
jgi:hypothetical protein